MSIHSLEPSVVKAAHQKFHQFLRERLHEVRTIGDVARAIGMSSPAVKSAILGASLNRPVRRRIEKLFAAPIWSTEAEARDANTAQRVLGIDPFTSSIGDVRLRAAELGLIEQGSVAAVAFIVDCAVARANGKPLPSSPSIPTEATNADLVQGLEERFGAARPGAIKNSPCPSFD
jgi:hypothetical protein